MRYFLCAAMFSFVTILFISPLSAEIKVVSVTGSVAYKTGQKWETLRVQTRLNPGAKISTGVNSSAVIQLDKHTVTVNQMTMVKIYENRAEKESTETKIGLRRGSIRAKIFREQTVKTVFKVSTPVATSSVRGTEELISYGPSKGMVIKVLDGKVLGESNNGARKYLYAGLQFHQRPGLSEPEPLLADIREKAIAAIQPKASTRDEQHSRMYHGDEFVDNSESPQNIIGNKVNANVNLFIQWP